MLRLLLDGDPKLKVVSVVGMAGLGKTTLVKKVYDYPGVKESFQCHAWITVSQSFQIEQILRDMLKQLFGEIKQPIPQVAETMNRVGLKEVLKEFLQQKRYVIVFDDIWRTDAWDDLKHALPDDNNSNRIMITTRIADVASYSSRSVDIYQLQPLDRKDAWDLFCRKAFRSDHTCPSGLQPLSEEILSKCGGLPLAIVVIASLLSTKDQKIEEWQSVLLRTQIESNAKLNNMMKIIMLSYDNLPHYLKTCLLYLSIFPEDYQFKRTKVVRLWVAEGFVEDKYIGSKAEYVAEGYFNELVNRSFIRAVRDHSFFMHKVKWQVHDLIHEMILQNSHDQNFATILANEEPPPVSPKIRRLSIHKSNEMLLISWTEGKSFSHLRSLLLFDISSSSVPLFSWDTFRLLKVLDLEGAPLEVFPEDIVKLFHLRFLSLKSTNIETIPPSIGMLSKLETLDLKHTRMSVIKLPSEMLKLKRLRHLLGDYLLLEPPLDSPPTFDCFQGSKLMPNGIGNLEALQTLTNIVVSRGTNTATELKSLTQLKRLGIFAILRREDGIIIDLKKMTNLRYLNIISAEEELIDLESLIISPSLLLQKLRIQGRLEKYPHWMPSLHNLERLYIIGSRLTSDPLEALQALPRLVLLYLHNAYDGEQLCFQAGGFQRLQVLCIYELENLKSVTVEKGAIPLLQKMMIYECALLNEAPIGIEFLKNLELTIFHSISPEVTD